MDPWTHGPLDAKTALESNGSRNRNRRPTVRMRIRGLFRIVLKLRRYLGKIRAVIGGPRAVPS